MNPIFRSPGFWKSAITTLPDTSFFELLRSVFGKIKTPFNKQKLAEKLSAFLQQPEILSNIAAYIDTDDTRVIAAVAALREPAPGELESFFSGEISYARLHDLIVNLEERFILYRFWEQGSSRLALNPVLEEILLPFAARADLLFPSVPAPDCAAGETRPAFDDRVFAGIISFVFEEKTLFKAEGELRKKISGKSCDVFPGIDIQTLVGGLAVLGIFRPETDALIPDVQRIYGFGVLSARERVEYLAAGIYCYAKHSLSPPEISPYLYRAEVRELGVFIHRLTGALEANRVYPQKTIERIAGILSRDCAPDADITGALVIDVMEKTGLLAKHAKGFSLAPPACDYHDKAHAAEGGAGNAAPLIAMDTAFSCVVYPGIGYEDIVDIALALSVREAGTIVRFELSRDSAIRAFNLGFSAEKISGLLKNLSGGRVDENMVWALDDWEKRYGEVSISRGLVLCLKPERRYLAETEPLAGLIRKIIAEGVYLLDEEAEWEAVDALRKAGVDIIASAMPAHNSAQTRSADPKSYAGNAAWFSSLSTRDGGDFSVPAAAAAARAVSDSPENSLAGASGLKDAFHSILDKTRFTKEEREELSARIDRRLVLSESQLKDAAVRYEKLEAHGLDYAGKALIAKQAIAMKSPLELQWAASADNTARVVGIPVSMEKNGGESVLILSPLEKDGDTNPAVAGDMRIPLGKISLLRRIKKSLFEH